MVFAWDEKNREHIALHDVSEIVRVIHAMDLTPAMKKRFRRRRR